MGTTLGEQWAASSVTDRNWVRVCGAVALAALCVRAYNAFAFPPLIDYDGAGQALHTLAWYEGRPPHLRSWSGFHPPLYYMIGALGWRVLPDALPMHVALRWLSLAFGAATLLLVFRALARTTSIADAAVTAVVVWCIPFVAIATSMSGNETLCAFLVTLLLLRTQGVSAERAPPAAREALAAGALGGLALLAKSTASVAIAAVALDWLRNLRAAPGRSLAGVVLMGVAALVVASPHYARIALHTGNPLALVSAGEASPEVRAVMATQPPGERKLGDYLAIPAATFVEPVYDVPALLHSVPGLLYASSWADAQNQFIHSGWPHVLDVQVLLSFAGLLPSALLALGCARVLRRPREHSRWLGGVIFIGLLGAAFCIYVWRFPTYTAIKPSYFFSAVLPASYLTAVGLGSFRGRFRSALRIALLVIAAGATAAVRWGWWR